MGHLREAAVGIDLGTTNSVVARLNELGRPQTLANAEGDKLTPSVVLFDGQETVVGKEAVKAMATDADRVATCAKRFMGERAYPRVVAGRRFPPEVLQAWILHKLRADTFAQTGGFDRAVITVPAYFDEVRRKATLDAGYIAGIEVLDIINEPTAAALAFGHQLGILKRGQSQTKAENVLVYDLGGGTFDVTVLEIGRGEFTALATDGDVRLGGWDWDQRLVDHVAERCLAETGIDPRPDPNVAARLWRQCEETKRTLSARAKAMVTIDIQGQTLAVEVTREQFQELTQDLLDRTAFTTQQTLQAAGLEWSELQRVLMIGGSTRMQAVEDMLRELSGLNPDRSVSPDEAVAHGAAMQAGYRLSQAEGKPTEFQVTNVNSHSLGIAGKDPNTRCERNVILIPRNTPLPVAAERVFKTESASQRSIRIRVVEGESLLPEECSVVGSCTVRELPPHLPAQTPIEVLFRYTENGRLTIVVNVAGQTLRHEMARENSLSQERLDQWRQHVSGAPW
jgi:molecular chaperone DnaK